VRLFKFKCDCGSGKEIITTFGKTESCGCLQREVAAKTIFRTRRKVFGEAQMNAFYCRVVNRATRDAIEFRLTREEFKEVTSRSCFYCGAPPTMVATAGRNRRCYGNYIHNGIDRVDSSKGYVTENVVACCTPCNLAKGTRSQQEFYAWIKCAHDHLLAQGLI
jgi:5-methylcytosine-specific restriction endonuclease McrA